MESINVSFSKTQCAQRRSKARLQSRQALMRSSSRFQRELPLLLDVPNYEGVRIHPGNGPEDTEGCLLPGRSPSVDFVGNSKPAFEALFKKLSAALKSGDKVTIEISEGGVSPYMPAATKLAAKPVAAVVHGLRVIADPLRLRAAANAGGAIVARLPHGQVLITTGEPAATGWLHVTTELEGVAVTGFVSAEYVEDFAIPAVAPAPVSAKASSPATPAAAAATSQLYRVKPSTLNLRKTPDPSKDSNVIASLPQGQLVTKIADADEPFWWQVETMLEGKAHKGFVNLTYLEPQAAVLNQASAEVAETSDVQLTEKALALIIEFEGIDQPGKWPGGGSGITLGVGYDLGYKTLNQFRSDWGPWLSDAQLTKLAKALGKTGAPAKAIAYSFSDIRVTRSQGEEVFNRGSVPVIKADTLKAFSGIKRLPPDVQGALCCLVFNRGSDMRGDRRTEMREIRDAIDNTSLTMKERLRSIEASLRAMKRIWEGTDVGAGLIRRRFAEADLVKSCI